MRSTKIHLATGALILAVGTCVHAQGGGMRISPEQASAVIAAKAKDKEMAAAALSAIKGAGVDVSKVKASAHNGVVTLKGSVSTDSQVQAAATAVKSGSGVVTVKNKLRVRN